MLDIKITPLTYDYIQIADANTRTLAQRAADDIKPRLRRAADDILVIGQRLAVVRQYLPHGQWMDWIETEFEMGDETARNFINVATRFDGKFQNFGNLKPSALYMLAAPNTPDDAIVEVETRIAAGSVPTVAETKQIIAAHKGYGRCARCGRPLTDPGSIAAGVGPCCATHNHAGNGHGADAEADSDTEAQFVTAAWDMPTERTVDDLPVYGMSDDDVDVVYARGNRKSIADEEDAPLPDPMATRNTMAVHFSSAHDSHYTPDPIWQAAQRVMGGIDLDPCSNSHAHPNIPASRHYTAEDDGLRQVWQGSIFLNPPYGTGIGDWIAKLVEAHAAGDVPQAIALIPARVDTRWWQMIRDYPVCFVTGRITFKNNDSGAPFPSAVVYLGSHTDKFIREFDHFGDIWRRIHA